MSSFFLRACILGACSLSWFAWGANVSCAEVGKAYNDSSVSLPQLYVADEAACQAACAGDPSCTVFTYYTNKGACWKLTEKAVVLEMTNATLAEFAVSGPKSCNETAAEGMDATPMTGGGVTITDSENNTKLVSKDKDGGIPWWAWLLIVGVSLICIERALHYYYYRLGDKEEGEAKTKKKKAQPTTRGVEFDVAEAVSLAQATAPASAGLPQMAPVPTISTTQAVMQGAFVLPQQPQPAHFVQAPAQQYYQMPPRMYMPVQQGYEYEMTSQLHPRQVSRASTPSMAGTVTYSLQQGYEQV